jgi:predicted AAA+ superfamily ATPase
MKDISALMNIDKPEAFILMIKILASQDGQLLNYGKLANQIGISEPTLKQYLYYAINTYAIKQLSPFFRNKQKEILKANTIYFNDLGLRNYSIGLM